MTELSDFKRGDIALWLSNNPADRWVGVCVGLNNLYFPIFNWRNVLSGAWAKATITATDYDYLYHLGPVPGEAEWDV